MRSACRRRVARLALAAAALMLATAGAELLWRHLRADRFGPATNLRYAPYDQLLGWRYQAGASTRHRAAGFDVAVEIDGQGRRAGADCGPAPGVAAATRLVFLGDSFTFGWGVEAGDAFPCRVARELGAEAVNLGVAGYSTDQEYLLLDAAAAAEGASAVVLQVCRNDLAEVLAGVRWGRPKPLLRLLPDGALAISPARDRASWLGSRSALLSSLRSLSQRALERPATPAERTDGVALVTALVERMATRTAAAGADFVLLTDRVDWLAPSFTPPGGVRVEVAPILAAAAARGEPVEIPGDGHWSAHGHRLVADELVRALRARAAAGAQSSSR